MRRVVIYLALAAFCLLVGGVGLSGELNAEFYEVDGTIVGTATGRSGSTKTRTTVYYVLIRRDGSGLREEVRHKGLYDAVRASDDTRATLEIEDVGQGVQSVNRVRYRGRWYGTGRATEGKVVGAVFLALGVVLIAVAFRRRRRVRRSRVAAAVLPGVSPRGS